MVIVSDIKRSLFSVTEDTDKGWKSLTPLILAFGRQARELT